MGPSPHPAPDTRPTVLVVDDDPRGRALVAGCLGTRYRVIEAEDGKSALARLASDDVDCVLLDIMLPDTSGFEVCLKIREMPREGFLPVLMLSALGDQEDRNAGLEAGADDFLSKPVDVRELGMRVRAFVRIRQQDRTIRRQLEELRRLDGLKDDLVSLLVHDLRSPLSSLLSLLHVLGEDVTDPLLRGDLDDALAAGARAREVVDDMLQVRLFEEGRLAAHLEPARVATVVREGVATLSGVARLSGVPVRVAAATDPLVPVDRKLLRRAVENLVANGIKYAARGTSVEVSVRADDAGGAVVEVADRGPGVPPELKQELFQKFGSLEARRGEARRGIGLGLYLVKLVASAHSGSVEALDREGGGTIFRLQIPAAP